MVDPITHEAGAGHDTTERFVPAATLIALDQLPAGPAVVVVVACAVVVVVGALEDPDVWLHPAARNSNARAASAAQSGLVRPGTTTGPGARWPRERDDVTTYRAR